VARLAGVSHTTVSRVLNKHDNVKPRTRSRVLKVIKELGYSPHSSARSLSSGKTHSIGLLVFFNLEEFPSEFLPPILAGLTTYLNQFGYSVMLLFDQVAGSKDQVPPEWMAKSRIDGLILLSVETEAAIAYKVAKASVPVVVVNQKVTEIPASYVAADDEGGAYAATSHLLELGHEKIAFIGGSPQFSTSKEREVGYKRALREKWIEPNPNLVKIGYYNKRQGYSAMKELLNERSDLTAVFAANDLMAVGAMTAIKEMGLSIPADISVVGFDDQLFAAEVEPALTTVKKPRSQMGSESARVILEMIGAGGEAKVIQLTLSTQLVVRQSTGPLVR